MGKTYQSVVVNAPAETVWAKLRDFHDMSWAPDVVTNVDIVGDKKGDQPGAKRVLNGAFHETLHALDDDNRELTYSIDEGPSPVSSNEVSSYEGHVRVRPVTEGDGGTFVEWYSSWTGNDEAAQEFCQGIYTALLGQLKKALDQ
ncbi:MULTISPECIES: SRPBCC family protein [Marinobacter]|uniref:SRPBCC family protein n=1 Tax=Marinobacter metalliresistant TaxID=2961995 RepID=A0ABZ2VXE3_9GAMM|nr:SRPBCC family protein [Marinobacter sp. Arc7-DN-1]AXS83649.1 SRPBCC family protein [Marinobacter sp. Arc7-DN-1]